MPNSKNNELLDETKQLHKEIMEQQTELLTVMKFCNEQFHLIQKKLNLIRDIFIAIILLVVFIAVVI